jgi:hypothetical protein
MVERDHGLSLARPRSGGVREQAERLATDALGGQEFEILLASGRDLGLDGALAYALAEDEVVTSPRTDD